MFTIRRELTGRQELAPTVGQKRSGPSQSLTGGEERAASEQHLHGGRAGAERRIPT